MASAAWSFMVTIYWIFKCKTAGMHALIHYIITTVGNSTLYVGDVGCVQIRVITNYDLQRYDPAFQWQNIATISR